MGRCSSMTERYYAGRWRLQCPGPADGAAVSCERTTAAADITLPVAALGAGYLCVARLGTLATAGLITEHRKGAVAMLSAAMYSDPAPGARRHSDQTAGDHVPDRPVGPVPRRMYSGRSRSGVS
jgi:hypothetical protein